MRCIIFVNIPELVSWLPSIYLLVATLLESRVNLCFIYCRKDTSQENDFKDAVAVCLPLINAAIKDIEKGIFPKSCSLNVEIPTSPLSTKVCVLEVPY